MFYFQIVKKVILAFKGLQLKEKGFSLLESLLVVVVISSIVFLIANIPNALMLINKSKHTSLAREIASKQIEDKRSLDYINISLGSFPIDDLRISSLPQGSGTVEVGIKDETTPDPDDWIPCDTTTICPAGEEIKQVKVIVGWVDINKPQSITIDTLIGEGGINQ